MSEHEQITSTFDADPAASDEASFDAPVDAPTPPQGDSYFWEPPAPPAPPKETGGGGRAALAWFLAALLGAGAGAGASYVALDGGRSGIANVRTAAPVDPSAFSGSVDAAAVVAEAVLPSIVQVQVRVAGPFGGGSGLGSGVIYSPEGFIITNDHVVAGADQITVNLSDGTSLDAALVGSARSIGVDIAVLKVVPERPLPSAIFGTSRDLRVGELAVAIGSPFGLEATVTAGIISALHRNEVLEGGVRFTDAIQTDAPINQGNSGGALANARGEVVGINTAILGGSSGGNVGIGFAIPIDIARKVADQIIETGEASLPFLGISGDNLPGGEGARVREVGEGSAADDAGMLPGDIIISMDGEEVSSMDSLITLLIGKDVGQRVEIVVVRDGRERILTATLGARPPSE